MNDDRTVRQDDEERQRLREASRAPSDPPARVRGYQIRRFLGRGAFGEVWQAIDQATDVPVAIKFYSSQNEMSWNLLAREVEKLQFLANDQRVVRLREVGRDAKPPYYVMEYMEGGSLESVLRGREILPIGEALSIARSIASGLAHAHNRGVLHCDLKPANVLLDGNGSPRLADFGQARLSHDKTPALGTYLYMAPEQADLNAEPDARWDVYAFGALLYRMLVGRPPNAELMPRMDSVRSTNLRERLSSYREMIQQAPPPRDHYRAPGMDKALANIIDVCLSVDPKRRYPNIQAVQEALRQRARLQSRRPLLALGVVGPLLLMATVGGVGLVGSNAMTRYTTRKMVENARGVTLFGADLVAERAENILDNRWRVLQGVADDPGFREMVRASTKAEAASREAGHPPLSTPEGKALQDRMKALAEKEGVQIQASSWAFFDHDGVMLARWPLPKTDAMGKSWWFRDYFHGRGEDVDQASSVRPGPISAPYLTRVFRSVEPGTLRRVGFSQPVGEGDDRGVLLVTVDERQFVGLALDSEWYKGQFAQVLDDLVPVLVDRRGDAKDPKGLILAHPIYLDAKTHDSEERNRVRIDLDAQFPRGAVTSDDYRDPFGEDAKSREIGDYSGRWIASIRDVSSVRAVRTKQGDEPRPMGWAVIVQMRYDKAIAPVISLRNMMLEGGLIALLLVGLLTGGLWFVVVQMLNPLNRFRMIRGLRRRLGLSDRTLGTGTGTAGTASASATAGAATIEPHTVEGH